VKELPSMTPVELDSKIGLYEAFSVLLENNILSAPVYDEEKKAYCGFLDIRDLVSFVVFVSDEQKVTNNSQLDDIIKHGQQQFRTPTTDGVSVKYLARRHRFHPVSLNDPLLSVVTVLAEPDIHRVPVVENGRVVSILSQTTIIKFLSSKIQIFLDNSNDPTIEELGVGTSPVLSVKKSESVINTFRKMEKQQKSGIALVDEEGRLVGTTTGKDLGLFLKKPTLESLYTNIFDYLKVIRQEQIDERSPCISISSSDKLSKAVGLLAATRVHRIYVVDNESGKPVSVVSITDIFKFIVKK